MADDELSRLRAELTALQQRLAAVEQVASTRPAVTPSVPAATTDVATGEQDDAAAPIGRRQLLRRLGYAAAGAAAVGALAGGERAAAANGDPILIGTNNTGTTLTTLTGSTLKITGTGNGSYPLWINGSDTAHIKLAADANLNTAGPLMGLIAKAGDNVWFANGNEWRTFGGVGCAGALYLLDTPVRVYDSRDVDGALTPNTDRAVSLSAAIPVGASGAIINLTATGYNGVGLFAVFPSGTWQGNSTLNYSVGAATATSATTAVSATRSIQIRCSGAGAQAIVDVVGYYR